MCIIYGDNNTVSLALPCCKVLVHPFSLFSLSFALDSQNFMSKSYKTYINLSKIFPCIDCFMSSAIIREVEKSKFYSIQIVVSS